MYIYIYIYVNTSITYPSSPSQEVINGCSNLLVEIFGAERGAHARSAVGTNSLPRNVPVEIEMITELAPAELPQTQG